MIKRVSQYVAIIVFICLSTNQLFGQTAKKVESISITVSDLDRSIQFFSEVLTFKTISIDTVEDKGLKDLMGLEYQGLKIRKGKMQLGDEIIELIEFVQPTHGRRIPLDSKSNDLWFQHIAIVTNDMDEAYKILQKHK